MPATDTRTAYVNGEFLPVADAKVSIFDRGFLFGDGIYEVAAVLDGKLVDSASHLARLERSLVKSAFRCIFPQKKSKASSAS